MIDYSGIDLSFYHSLLKELGPEEVFERYFDDDMMVRDDAPEKLREEIRALRADDDCPSPPPGVVWR